MAGTPFSNNISEASTPTSLKSNLPLVTSGTYGSGTDLYMLVLNVLSEPASIESDHGVHIDEIAKRLRLPASKIMEAIEFHVNCGNIFTTIDDFHYKSAFIDRVCIPPWVTSGTNGSGTYLYAQVLNVFSEPESTESDHGVHIDEIAKRLKLPAGKIKEAIEFHVDCGLIYSTIDDFHYKSAFIDQVCNSPRVTSGTNGSGIDWYAQVLNVFSEPGSTESDHGVHINEIAKRLKLPAGKIKEAIEFHVDCGLIYSTIDDFHYKSAFLDRACNSPPVTSRTNGPETDLYRQVLNVFSEPASIESGHGVHIDEIATRLKLPASKIKEAIDFHVNCGHICFTIDDFHYKSALY
uniref:Uncharacterized protein n=1 Tax=Avena sativa TaxID=4498 RepID=A0ACD5YCN9_AVESA